jgi:2-dehydropantoate 2-reductase
MVESSGAAPTRRPESRPSVAVVGVGAIGAVVAKALDTRADVTLCRRGTTAPMAVDAGSGPQVIHANVIEDPADAHVVDWVVLATKAHQIQDASPWLNALIGPSTRVAVLQNGVSHADRVQSWVSPDRVVPAIVFTSAERTSSNSVTVPTNAAAIDFASLLDDTLPAIFDPEFAATAWRKLVMNAAISSVTALTGQPIGVADTTSGRELVAEVLQEGISVGLAQGLPLADDELTRMRATIGALPPTARTSMQTDRFHKRPTEFDYLTGAVVRAAEVAGVPVPSLRILHSLLAASEAA